MTKVWVTVPTLDEVENLDTLVQRIRAAVPDAHILVVDDGSADGTADKAEALGAELGGIEVLRRPRKMGLGSAYRAGHAIGIARGYDVMIQIDADLSHDPAALPDLLAAVERGADLAIGSRYVPGGSVPNWPKRRLLLSVWGNRYAGFVLGLRRARLHRGLPRVPRVDPARDGHRVDALDRLRVPDRDDVPRAARGRAHRRGPDRVHRPRARHLEDVGPHRRRGDDARHAVGDPRSGPARGRPPLNGLKPDPMVGSAHHVAAGPPDRPTRRRNPAGQRFWIGLGGDHRCSALAWRVFYVIHERRRILLNGDAAYYHWQANLVAQGLRLHRPDAVRAVRHEDAERGPPARVHPLPRRGVAVHRHQRAHAPARVDAARRGRGLHARRPRPPALRERLGGLDRGAARGRLRAPLDQRRDAHVGEHVRAHDRARGAGPRTGSGTSPRTRTAVLMGLGIALAALSRAEAISLFPFLAIPFAFLVTRKRGGARRSGSRASSSRLASCLAGGLLMAPWVGYNLTRFDHPVLLVQRRRQRADGRELRLDRARRPARRRHVPTARSTAPTSGTGRSSAPPASTQKLDQFYSPKRAAYLKAQLGDIPGTDINFFGDESTHEVAWRAVGTAEIKDHLSQMPWMVVLRVARMWDLFRPSQNIILNGLLEGRGVLAVAARDRSSTSRCSRCRSSGSCCSGAAGCRSCRSSRSRATITITAATSFGVTRVPRAGRRDAARARGRRAGVGSSSAVRARTFGTESNAATDALVHRVSESDERVRRDVGAARRRT